MYSCELGLNVNRSTSENMSVWRSVVGAATGRDIKLRSRARLSFPLLFANAMKNPVLLLDVPRDDGSAVGGAAC